MQKSVRKEVVRLTLAEKWAVMTYMIENRCVLNTDGVIAPRMQWTQIAKEVNGQKVITREINSTHIPDVIATYVQICALTKNMPFQTPQDTVVADQLSAKLEQANKDIESYKTIQTNMVQVIESYKKLLHKITQIIPAEIFGMKV